MLVTLYGFALETLWFDKSCNTQKIKLAVSCHGTDQALQRGQLEVARSS